MGMGRRAFEILHPQSAQYGNGYSDNDKSCVLKIQSKNFSALLTGDIGAKVEDALSLQDVPADVLLAAHHGSRYSSTAAFLKAVQPTAGAI